MKNDNKEILVKFWKEVIVPSFSTQEPMILQEVPEIHKENQ